MNIFKEQQQFLQNISDDQSLSMYKVTGTLKICYKSGRRTHSFFLEKLLKVRKRNIKLKQSTLFWKKCSDSKTC